MRHIIISWRMGPEQIRMGAGYSVLGALGARSESTPFLPLRMHSEHSYPLLQLAGTATVLTPLYYDSMSCTPMWLQLLVSQVLTWLLVTAIET